MTRYRLQRTQIIPRPVAEVFGFFEDAFNLEVITPPWLHFRILTPPPIVMGAGMLLDYRLSLFGVPFYWRTKIEEHVPGVSFVDCQIRGPYQLWRHEHQFEAIAEGTRMLDQVDYEMPLGPLGSVAHAIFVQQWLTQIFDYRAATIARLFPASPAAASESSSSHHSITVA